MFGFETTSVSYNVIETGVDVANTMVGSQASLNLLNFGVLDANGKIPSEIWNVRSFCGFASLDQVPGTKRPPYSILDDSATEYEQDELGIIDSSSTPGTDIFFAALDTVNDENPAPHTCTATWNFDISGRPSDELKLFIDMAAMGDFESDDNSWIWKYSVDGGESFESAFASSVDTEGTQVYEMASGTKVRLRDPLLMNGERLSNKFKTFETNISAPKSASKLTLVLEGYNQGMLEAVAFRNIRITAQEPCCSDNYRTCKSDGWCSENEANCNQCGAKWVIVNPNAEDSQCLGLWENCKDSSIPCCFEGEHATCVNMGAWYSQCQPLYN